MRDDAPPLPALPTETWTDILANHGLSYFDLKRVGQTSKAFKTLIESSPLDLLLFRGQPTRTLPRGTDVILHPLLLHCTDLVQIELKNFLIRETLFDNSLEPDPSTPESWRIHELVAADECTTSPPVTRLYLRGDGIGPGGSTENSSGVRVLDVLELLRSAWGAVDPRGCQVPSEACRTSGCSCTYYHTREGFFEWTEPTVLQSGIVRLTLVDTDG